MRGAFEATRTGWVYRSDVEAPVAAPHLDDAVRPPRSTDAGGDVPRASRAAVIRREEIRRPHVEVLPPWYPLPAPAASAQGWIETGLYLMTLPMTITLTVMFAPVIWMFGPRSRR